MSPINPIVLQRRHAEMGRIRIGDSVETKKRGGGTFNRPRKLTTFRFTSGNRDHIEQLAGIYGGQVNPWDNGGKAEWDVTTDAKSIPVLVVKGGLSQWMETWSGGDCVHRCDGVTNDMTKELCVDDQAHRDAKPYTRLSVMLSDLESLGVWRLETHGWNAAAELPNMAELAQVVADLVPARLHLRERSSKGRDDKGAVVSRQFVVPVLDLEVSKARLLAIVGGTGAGPAIGSGRVEESRQISAGPADPWEQGAPDFGTRLLAAATVEECTQIWHEAGHAGALDDELKAAIQGRVAEIRAAAGPTGPVDEVVEGSVDVDPAVEAAWQELVLEAGKHDVGDSDLREMLEQEYAQPVEDLTAEQLRAVTANLRAAS